MATCRPDARSRAISSALPPGRNLRDDALDSDGACDGFRDLSSIAREQHQFATHRLEARDRRRRSLPERIGDTDQPPEDTVDGDQNRRATLSGEFAGSLGERRGCDAGVFEPACASREHGTAIDRGGDSAAGDRRKARSGRDGEAQPAGFRDDRFRERMPRARFGSGGEPQQLAFGRARHDSLIGDRGPARRERAGLVEDDGVDPSRGLERRAAFDESTQLRSPPRRNENRRRSGEPHRARAGDDQDGDGIDEGQRETSLRRSERHPRRERAECDQQDDRNEDGADPVGKALHGSLRSLGFFDHADDLLEHGVGADPRDPHPECAGPVDRASEHLVIEPLGHGTTFPVSMASFTFEPPSTTTPSRGTVSPSRTESRSRDLDLVEFALPLDAVGNDARPTHLQAREFPERAGRTRARAGLEHFAE
jgi:hypothetical protein